MPAKIFCGGITQSTTDEMLADAFSSFGTVEDAKVMRERDTSKSRGFGFVTFSDPSAVQMVLSSCVELDGRVIDCKSAQSREDMNSQQPQFQTQQQPRHHAPQRQSYTGGRGGGVSYNAPARSRGTPAVGRIVSGKVFVGGLSSVTTQESLLAAMDCVGEIEEVMVMYDKETGKSRGFGFVTFQDTSSVNVLLQTPNFEVDGKVVECKPAQAKADDSRAPAPQSERHATPRVSSRFAGSNYTAPRTARSAPTASAKIFIGGLPADADEAALRNYFSQFGVVVDAAIMMDKLTGKSRGFGFVTYSNETELHTCLAQRDNLNIDGKWVDCKQAVPEETVNAGLGKGMQQRGYSLGPHVGKGKGKGQRMGQTSHHGARRPTPY
eukprot:GEMP01047484.1.p1 GENE.GEMP01047484.1~~GEMP01047484.1.p1  ORF type:complete len:398 (+),score=105.32 GEMP01047484.1:56-1195(+)